jgi:hypothetical protein
MNIWNWNKKIFGQLYPTFFLIYWLGGFIHIAEGAMLLLTLGLIRTGWSSNYYKWIIKSRCKNY